MDNPVQDIVAASNHAPTMGSLAKIRYTHQDMIDYIIANPQTSQGALAARYGYTQSWICNVMASDAWQSAFAARREEIIDPVLKMNLEERMKGLVSRSLEVLMAKLDAPMVSDQVALRALELGAKSIGMGAQLPPAAPPGMDHLARLAERLIDLQSHVRKGITIEVQPTEAS